MERGGLGEWPLLWQVGERSGERLAGPVAGRREVEWESGRSRGRREVSWESGRYFGR